MSVPSDAQSGPFPAAEVRASFARALALGPRLLIALFAGVHSRDAVAAIEALRALHAYALRVNCPELASWCEQETQQCALGDLKRLESTLPALVRVWEQSQQALVARGFPPASS